MLTMMQKMNQLWGCFQAQIYHARYSKNDSARRESDSFWEKWYNAECPERLRLVEGLDLQRACVVWQISEGNPHSLNSLMNSYLDDLATYLERRFGVDSRRE